jgi:hypothetical protein
MERYCPVPKQRDSRKASKKNKQRRLIQSFFRKCRNLEVRRAFALQGDDIALGLNF